MGTAAFFEKVRDARQKYLDLEKQIDQKREEHQATRSGYEVGHEKKYEIAVAPLKREYQKALDEYLRLAILCDHPNRKYTYNWIEGSWKCPDCGSSYDAGAGY